MTWSRKYEKLRYLLWAGRKRAGASTACPACGSHVTKLIKRKYLVTSLHGCQKCFLMFRVPKDDWQTNRDFYDTKYEDGFTTEFPSDAELEKLKLTGFKGSEKDYTGRIGLIKAAGVAPGKVLFEFGCSWGYSSWQLRDAGFNVYSYEVSRPRARYAAEKLGCTVVPEPDDVPEKVDCFYSAHVIEHLPDPRLIWKKADAILKPDGLVVLLMPNGEPSREEKEPNYHLIWGQVHPLLLRAKALDVMAREYGFIGSAYTSPYDLHAIANGTPGQLDGDELLFVAKRAT